MPRRRRRIQSWKVYEIVFRARHTLPLSSLKAIKLLIKSYVARAQRDHKVILCHDIWNGSHCHIIVVALDSQEMVNFYSEVQKKLTDAIKRLLGIRWLNIWEGNCHPILLNGKAEVVDQIAYLYANPGQDNLEDCIELFPGLSSWHEYQRSLNTLEAKTTEFVPWIRVPSIPLLESDTLTAHEDRALTKELRKANKMQHSLDRHPNAWMKVFKIKSDAEVKEINKRILWLVRDKEKVAREKRIKEDKPLLGAIAMLEQPILKPHEPKKHGRKIFVVCYDNELRMALIKSHNDYCAECSDCYERVKAGDRNVRWPPGAFKPPLPPLMNIIAL